MRTLTCMTAAASLATLAISCVRVELPGPQVHTSVSAGVERLAVIRSGGSPVLCMPLGQGAQKITTGDRNIILGPRGATRFYIWPVNGAGSVAQAIPLVPGIISSELRNFKPTASRDVAVGGARGRQLIGTGTEAEDGTPGSAEVVVFGLAGHVFVACVHGKGMTDGSRSFMMQTLMTARLP